MSKNKALWVGGCLFLGNLTLAVAAPQPAAMNVGGLSLVPFVELEEKFDSNILYSETNEKSSTITTISPTAQLGLQKGVNVYGIQAAIQAGFYASSSDDNYVDAQTQASVHQEFTRRNVLDLQAQYNRAHDYRGTGYTQGIATIINEPDRYHTLGFGGDYTYGSTDAIGRIKLSAAYTDKVYDNHRNLTEARDRSNTDLGATFYYQIQPKTALLFELKQTIIDYTLSAVTLDSTETRYYVGGEWEITAITTGNARAGWLQKNFDSANRKDFSGFSWVIGGSWTPIKRSEFTLQTSGKTDETNGVGDYIDSKSVTAGWNHEWSSRVSSNLTGFVVKNVYTPSTQKEGLVAASLGVTYNMRRWLNFSAKYGHSRRLSNRAGQDFKKNEISLAVLITL